MIKIKSNEIKRFEIKPNYHLIIVLVMIM